MLIVQSDHFYGDMEFTQADMNRAYRCGVHHCVELLDWALKELDKEVEENGEEPIPMLISDVLRQKMEDLKKVSYIP